MKGNAGANLGVVDGRDAGDGHRVRQFLAPAVGATGAGSASASVGRLPVSVRDRSSLLGLRITCLI